MASHGELQFMFLGLFMNSDIQLEGNDCNCLLEILNELMTENLESDRNISYYLRCGQ
ncbi:25870_t:CDS:1, partial [Gigaspora rosea]